jgi:hypothetical protein
MGIGAVLVLGMAVLAPLEREQPRAYHSVLLVAGLTLTLVALIELSDVLGANGGSGASFWIFGVFAVIAGACAGRLNSAICALIGALAAGASFLSFVDWVFDPKSVSTFRYLLLVLVVAYAVLSLALRDRPRRRPLGGGDPAGAPPIRAADAPGGSWRRHAVQLVNAAGIATLALAASFVIDALGALFAPGGAAVQAAWGWELFLLIAGCALLAYAAVDHEPGPGYLGFAVLLAFALLVAQPDEKPSLIGWPIFLLLVGGLAVAAGLRPLRPLPPEPGAGTQGGLGVREPVGPRPVAPTGTATVPLPEPPPESGEPAP